MCGIAGIWNRRDGTVVDPAILARMQATLRHRGPDDAGTAIDRAIGLGHQRLAILDLSQRGHQPMTTADGRYTIVFNGEIYNYRELARRPGVPVDRRSTSDTEVLLHLLATEGPSVIPLLRGMFAFAFWDRDRDELIIARDAFGKKPLYHADIDGIFLFASEPKALLAHPAVSRAINEQAVGTYFLYEYVPAPATIYRDIRQLPMGSCMRVTRAEIRTQRWWKPAFLPKRQGSEQENIQALDRHLHTAVERRLIADVPVGVFLSGGLDSATILWYAQQHTATPLRTFSISFDNASFDESPHAARVAKLFGTTHETIPFTVGDVPRTVDVLTPLVDEPFADASLLPTYLLSAAARPHITVALDGDGSDELFGGYGTFPAALVATWFPRGSASLLQRLAELLPTRYENFSFDFKIKSFTKGLSYELPRRNQIWLGSFSDQELSELLLPPWRLSASTLFSDVDMLVPELRTLSSTDAISLLTISHYLQNDILVKLDRATMVTALEARTPFLDLDLADFALHLPPAAKWQKRILKRLMRGRLPDTIVHRPKKGFGIPLGHWLRGPLRDFAEKTLDPETLKRDGILNPSTVQRLLSEHIAGKRDHRKKLWTLITFQRWYDHWIA